MEISFITLQISAPTYWGFQYKVPLNYALSVTHETLVKEMYVYMKNFFNINNLQELKEGVDKLHLCIHDNISPTSTIVYLCNHGHE